MRPSQTSSAALSRKDLRFFHSWSWTRSDFSAEFAVLIDSGKLAEDAGFPVLWNTKHKFVLLAETFTGRKIVYKTYRKTRAAHYMFHVSPLAAEALNYAKLAALGFPMAELLAVGDTREFFLLKSGFLATAYVENSADGRAFYGDGKDTADTAARDEFIRGNLALLAKLHDAGIYHRAFTPANLLWRRRTGPDKNGNRLELFWIDVASCREKPDAELLRLVPADIANFLAYFDFDPAMRAEFVRAYTQAVRVPRLTPEQLTDAVEVGVQKILAERTAVRA